MYNDKRNKTLSELRKQTLFRRFAFILLFVILAGSLAGVGSLLFSNSSITDETGRGEAEVEVAAIGGAGTSTNPFLINSLADLQTMRDAVNAGTNITGATQGSSTGGTAAARTAAYKLMLDIDFGTGNTTNWVPIGTGSGTAFQGVFDGNQHIIKNLYINSTATYQGLFGYAINATIKNLGIVGGTLNVGPSSAAVLGYIGGNTLVDTCFNTATVSSSGSNVGGVVGQDNASATGNKMINCFNFGEIKGTGSESGGVAGDCHNIAIENCFNAGKLTFTSQNSGGVVGHNTTGAIIKNCYNVGQSNHYGIAGTATGSSNCYNAGSATISISPGTLTNCFSRTGSATTIQGTSVAQSNMYAYTSETNNCLVGGSMSGLLNGDGAGKWYKRPNDSSTDQAKMYYPELKAFAEHTWKALQVYSKASVQVSGPTIPEYNNIINTAPTCTANTAISDVPWIGNGTK